MAQTRITWLDRARRLRGLLVRIDRDVDADFDPLSVIYARWRLSRFCAARTFRLYGQQRRQRIRTQIATMRRREREGLQRPTPATGGAA